MTANDGRLGIGRTALLVVDMQNAYCAANGSFARLGTDVGPCADVIEPCRKLVNLARAAGVPVLFTAKIADHQLGTSIAFEGMAAQLRQIGALQRGSEDAELVPALRPIDGEPVIEKFGWSAFFGTGLDIALRRMGVRELVVAGVTTSVCVESTVRDAAQFGYRTYVVSDATAEYDDEVRQRSLQNISRGFAKLMRIRELRSEWGSAVLDEEARQT